MYPTYLRERMKAGGTGRGVRYPGSGEELVRRLAKTDVLRHHVGCVNTLAYNDTGSLMVSGSDDRHLAIWDMQTHKLNVSVETAHASNIFAAKFVPDREEYIVSGAYEGETRLCDLNRYDVSLLLNSGSPYVSDVSFSPEYPLTCFTAAHDGFNTGVVRQHDLREPGNNAQVILRLQQGMRITRVCFCPAQPHVFAIGADDPKVKLYDIRFMIPVNTKARGTGYLGNDGTRIQPFLTCSEKHKGPSRRLSISGISGLAWNSTGRELACNYTHDDVLIYNVADLSEDSVVVDRLATRPSDSGPFVFDDRVRYADPMAEVEPPAPPAVHPPAARFTGRQNIQTILKEVKFFCNDKFIITGGDCGRVYIWSRATRKLLRCPRGDGAIVNCVMPHPHLEQFATAGISSTIKVWGPSSGVPLSRDDDRHGMGVEDSASSGTTGSNIDHFMDFDSDFDEESGDEEEEEEEDEEEGNEDEGLLEEHDGDDDNDIDNGGADVSIEDIAALLGAEITRMEGEGAQDAAQASGATSSGAR